MRLDYLLSLFAAAVLAIVLAISGYVLSGVSRRLLLDAEGREVRVTADVFQTALDQAATLSLTHAEAVAADPVVKRLMALGDRAGLQAHARPVLDRLKASAGVDVLHFHDAAMASFLRVWEPENFGQDLSAFRPMIISVNRHRKPVKGLEYGIKGLSLRAVAPIEDGNTLIGTVEAGVDLAALTELAKAATGSDFAVFLDPAAVGQADGTAGRLAIEAATDTAFFETLLAAGHVRLSRADYVERFEIDGRTLGVLGRPLLDYGGTMIGTIIVTCDVTALESHVDRSAVTLVAVLLCGFLVTFAAFMIAIRAFIVRPLEALSTWCTQQDDTPPPEGSNIGEFRALQDAATALKSRAGQAEKA